MENEQKVIVACPKCGQKLKCVLGGAGTCPKCGTRVVFPERMSQADPALNKEFFTQISESKTNKYEKVKKKPRKASKPRGILKKVIVGILALAVIGGGVLGGLKLKNKLLDKTDEKSSDGATTGEISWEVEYNGETKDLINGESSNDTVLPDESECPVIYSDEYFTMKYAGIGTFEKTFNKPTIAFYVQNNAPGSIKFLLESLSLDGVSYNDLNGALSQIAPNSSGVAYFYQDEEFTNKSPSTLSGSFVVSSSNDSVYGGNYSPFDVSQVSLK